MSIIDIGLSALDEFVGPRSTPYSNTLVVKSLVDVLRNQRQGPNGDKSSLPLACDPRWHTKLFDISSPQDASAHGASCNWAFCTLLCATVRGTPHPLVAKHLPHWLDLLGQHLRAADFRTRLAAALCTAAVIVRACGVGSDTRRDVSSTGQKLVQPFVNVLGACTTAPDRLAMLAALTEIATAAPSLVKMLGAKIISALFAMFDAASPSEARVAKAAGRCAGRVAAAVYGAANVNGVSQFIVSAIGSLHRVFRTAFEGCEGDVSAAPLWRQVVENCEFADLGDCDVSVMQSRVTALCETIVTAVTTTYPIPQQQLQQIQQQKLTAGFLFPTEALIDLIQRFTSINMDTIIKYRSLSTIPGFKLIGYVSFFHNIAYKLLDTIIVLHGRSMFPFMNSYVMPIITRGFWLCYRAPTPVSSADVKSALFHCATSILHAAGSGGAVCVAKPLIPYIRAELEGLFGDLQPANARDHRANTGGSSFATATAALGALEAILACCGDLLPRGALEEVAWMVGILLRVPAPGALGAAISRCAALCSVSGVGSLTALMPEMGSLVSNVLSCDGSASREAFYVGSLCEAMVHPRVPPVCVAAPVARVHPVAAAASSESKNENDVQNRATEVMMLDDAVPAKSVAGTVFSGQRPAYKPLEFSAVTHNVINVNVDDKKKKGKEDEEEDAIVVNDDDEKKENKGVDGLALNETVAKSTAIFDSVKQSAPSSAITIEEYVEISKEEKEDGANDAINEDKDDNNNVSAAIVIEEEKEENVEPEIKKQKIETKPPQPQIVNNVDDGADLLLMDDGPDEEDDDGDDEFN